MPGPAKGSGIVVGPQAGPRCGAWRREAPADGRGGRGLSHRQLGSAIGILRTKWAPGLPSTAGISSSEPSWDSATRLAIGRPRPEPPALLLARWKRSKIAVRWAG